MTNRQKNSAYLARIGFNVAPCLDFDTLCALQRRHLEAIPYENLDILQGIPLSLDVDDLFEKIILRRRGGYCLHQVSLKPKTGLPPARLFALRNANAPLC